VKRRVVWSAAAFDDFDRAIAFIAAESPNAARRIKEATERTGNDLGAIPTGRPGRVSGTYEKVVQQTAYLMAYSVSGDSSTVTILRIIHGARDWPTESWPAD
jgi:plasmid stabilization system protein ParE